MLRICLLAVLTATALPPTATAAPRCPAPEPAALTEALRQINALRAQNGLPAVTPDPRLMQAAQSHACDNAARGGPSHQGRDGSSLGQRLQRVGYAYRTAAENIAWGKISAAAVTGMWQGSPAHYRNLTLPQVSEAGLGLARDSRGNSAWVLKLAAPL